MSDRVTSTSDSTVESIASAFNEVADPEESTDINIENSKKFCGIPQRLTLTTEKGNEFESQFWSLKGEFPQKIQYILITGAGAGGGPGPGGSDGPYELWRRFGEQLPLLSQGKVAVLQTVYHAISDRKAAIEDLCAAVGWVWGNTIYHSKNYDTKSNDSATDSATTVEKDSRENSIKNTITTENIKESKSQSESQYGNIQTRNINIAPLFSNDVKIILCGWSMGGASIIETAYQMQAQVEAQGVAMPNDGKPPFNPCSRSSSSARSRPGSSSSGSVRSRAGTSSSTTNNPTTQLRRGSASPTIGSNIPPQSRPSTTTSTCNSAQPRSSWISSTRVIPSQVVPSTTAEKARRLLSRKRTLPVFFGQNPVMDRGQNPPIHALITIGGQGCGTQNVKSLHPKTSLTILHGDADSCIPIRCGEDIMRRCDVGYRRQVPKARSKPNLLFQKFPGGDHGVEGAWDFLIAQGHLSRLCSGKNGLFDALETELGERI